MNTLSKSDERKLRDLEERLTQKIADHQAAIEALRHQMKGIQDAIDIVRQIEDDVS